MTRNEKKQLLRGYIYLEDEIQSLKDQYEVLLTQATKITPTMSDGSGSHSLYAESKVEKNTIKLTEITNKIRRLEDRKTLVEKEIGRLKYHQRVIIEEVDINHTSIERVARSIHRNPNTVRNNRNNIIDGMFLDR